MKFDCGPTKAEREAARKAWRDAAETKRRQWHKVFIIWPRRVGSHDCRAFETVERRWANRGKVYPWFPCPIMPALVWKDGVPTFESGYGDWGWEYRACR